ncbi:hypothetical protein [Candidatus Pristimantibacillus sp. PTI5]|uniref:hypothetical protein n=1 Tax=Candidatus Pristimantibacillus sp. PTI5 TaxID=3400422 RepID=UPI003B025B67
MNTIQSGLARLSVVQAGDQYGMELISSEGAPVEFNIVKPITLEIKIRDSELPVVYESAYAAFELQEDLIQCKGSIVTSNGSEFLFEDSYRALSGQTSFQFERKVTVIKANENDLGFSTQFAIQEDIERKMEEYDYFAPGVWYSDNKSVVSGGIASDYNDEYFCFRITRLPVPLMMMQSKESKAYVTLCHVGPEPRTGFHEMTADWLVDESFQYASLGIKKSPVPSVRYLFPGSEGEKHYVGPNHLDKVSGWARRSHPVKTGVPHSYQFIIKTGIADGFASAMRQVWRHFADNLDTPVVPSDLNKVYEIGIQLLNTYCQEYNGAMGVPFWTNVPGGQVADVTFQMGFVGQQLQVAYQLLKYGLENDRPEMVQKGEGILAFWTSKSMTPSGLPKVWYDVHPADFKDHPSYIRIAADGMEGALFAYKVMQAHGHNRPEWLAYCQTFAEWLVRNQNEDGSFYRSYDFNGEPLHRGKFNTTNPVRFLVHFHWLTKDDRYLQTALRAGEYAYVHTYEAALYVGGTADNDNTIDKEAGILALYAFLALYDADGNPKWLEAAKGAADFCETWVFMWKYPVDDFMGNNVFARGRDITGQSLIATGHSHADVFMAYCAFDFYRLYLLTEDFHYLRIAKLLLHNTKQSTDWSGTLGHVYAGLVEESGEFVMQYHRGLGKWLPWCTIAEIEPITRLNDWFGAKGMDEIESQNAEDIRVRNHGSRHLF